MRQLKYIITALFLSLALSSQAQKFFNLTYNEVKVDSVLPYFGYSIPLGPDYADSVYTVQLLYPEFLDMSPSDIERYQKITSDTLPALPEVSQSIAVTRKQGSLEIGFCPLVCRDGRYQHLVSFMLQVEAQPIRRAARAQQKAQVSSAAARYASHSVLASGTWAKISVPETGVYRLTEELIKKAGFTDLSKVKVYGYGGNLQSEELNETVLTELDDLKEVPTCTVNGRRLFYAKGPVSWSANNATVRTRNPYADYGCYFLTQNDDEPATLDSAAFLASFYPAPDDYHVLHEIDNYAWFQGGRNLFENSPISVGESKTYTLATPHEHTSGSMTLALSAGTNSAATITLNGQELGTIYISLGSYDKGNSATKVYAVDSILSSNAIKITTTSGGPVRLDYISFCMDDAKAAPDLQNATFDAPDYVYNITNQDHHADSAVDMVIVIPTSQKLKTQAQRLADFHTEHDGLSVRIVPSDELINEFASGTPDASAYRRYMKMLYDRAETDDEMPKYLLLFGDCAWDNRMNTSDWRNTDPDDYLLCYESENSFNEITCYVSDDFFCLLDDNEVLATNIDDVTGRATNVVGKTDAAVGRFPVTTESDAKVLVDKTINYAENDNAGAWQNVLVFMGDDGNNNLHMTDVDAAAEQIASLHPGYIIKKVMWDAYKRETSSTGNTYPEATRIIKQYQSSGALIMDYAGHGRYDQISHENVLKLTDFQNFSNTNLPLWITASCDIMPFDGSIATIGEAALLNSKGGAVAFFGTTRTVYANYNKSINMAYLRHVLSFSNGKPVTLGEAQRLAKNEMVTTGLDRTVNKLQYSLLGDPALALNLPSLNVVIDSINDVPTSAKTNLPTLKAGSIARVKGHIEDASNFNGTMTATVRDARELITCRMNDTDETDEAFTFYDRTKTIFSGSDSVSQGSFDFSFAVPMDISYSDATGLINIHAVSNDHLLLAHGASDSFIVGGTQTTATDSIGPSIYCYLNSPSFINGDDVNCTPYFYAEIKDQDGINTSGSGIGHDLELIIDGEMSMTYNLNDNFQFDFGSYTSGSTYYYIPELEPGQHKLLFRAWDVKNNSSTVELSFNVVSGLEPNIFSISCTENPATTSTTFIITHDRTGCEVDVALDIFDLSGRLLWTYEESGVSTSSAYTIDWDLTTDEGRRLQTGVYLYRVRLASDGSNMASKAKKLVIIGNK